MAELFGTMNRQISQSQKFVYAGMLVLKWLDLQPKDGGIELAVNLPHDFAPLEPVIEQLVIDGHLEIDRRKGRYTLTKQGVAHLGTLIDEAEAYIDEFDDLEADEVVRIVRSRNLDPMRVRFLWGWYQGEFDDLVLFQQRRGIEVDTDWASFLLSDEFFDNLARDLA